MSSAVPTSNIQVESTVIAASVETCWSKFRELKLETVASGQVSKTELVSGSAGQVGSVIKITYANAGVWQVRLTEVSDRSYTIAYEVIETDPAMTYTSAEGEIALKKVSDQDHTFLTWTTIFSNDADAQVMADQKYKKLDFFVEFKKAF